MKLGNLAPYPFLNKRSKWWVCLMLIRCLLYFFFLFVSLEIHLVYRQRKKNENNIQQTSKFVFRLYTLCYSGFISVIYLNCIHNEHWHRIKIVIDFGNSYPIHFQKRDQNLPKYLFIFSPQYKLFLPIPLKFLHDEPWHSIDSSNW